MKSVVKASLRMDMLDRRQHQSHIDGGAEEDEVAEEICNVKNK